MRLCVGMDLHSSNFYTGIIDERSKKQFCRRLANDKRQIVEALAPYKGDIEGIAVESAYNWYWLVDSLMEEGYKVHLANPSAMKQYEGIKHLNDRHDAFWLVQMQGFVKPNHPVKDWMLTGCS